VQRQHAAIIERPLSIQNVLLDALDLMLNLRGIGWSWSHKPFPKSTTWSMSVPTILGKLFLKFVAFDISHCLMQHVRPSVHDPAGDTVFDLTLSFVPRYAWAAFCTICCAVMVDIFYHFMTLMGLILLRQHGNGHRSPIVHGYPPRSLISGASAGTNFSGTYSSPLAHGPLEP
jgi:hypothetical protein